MRVGCLPRLLEENEISTGLPERLVVWLLHQGCTASWFPVLFVEQNPAVFCLSEAM